jgi:hypothetical protein
MQMGHIQIQNLLSISPKQKPTEVCSSSKSGMIQRPVEVICGGSVPKKDSWLFVSQE